MRSLSQASKPRVAPPPAASPLPDVSAQPTLGTAAESLEEQHAVAKKQSKRRLGPTLCLVGAAVIAGVQSFVGTHELPIQVAMQSPSETLQANIPSPPASDPDPPVRLRNPFDHSEVFEFPPGTSPTAARDAVAEILMARARDRQTTSLEHRVTRKRTAAAALDPAKRG
jgi:hypothetical protein